MRPFVRSPLPLICIVTLTFDERVRFRGIEAALMLTLPESPLHRMESEEKEKAIYVCISHGDDFIDEDIMSRYEVTVHVQLVLSAFLLNLNTRRNTPEDNDVGGLVLFSAIKEPLISPSLNPSAGIHLNV